MEYTEESIRDAIEVRGLSQSQVARELGKQV